MREAESSEQSMLCKAKDRQRKSKARASEAELKPLSVKQ